MVIADQHIVVVNKLVIRLVGGFAIETADGQQINIANRKARGILAYLALSQNASESRERIAGLFWSDRGEDQARASLRQCLKQLRSIFEAAGFEGFHTGREGISFDTGAVDVDLSVIRQDLKRAS